MAGTVGIGLIGAGWMGSVHSAAYRRVPEHFPNCAGQARLVVAADDNEERARNAAARLGYERWTTDWREVVADREVDAVSITAPNYLHREVALAASAAGKHFWCEKPVGRSASETADVAAAAAAGGVRSVVGFNYRQAPAVQYAAHLISSGELGTVCQYRSQFLAGYGANPDGALSWRFLRSLAGQGVLGDLMSHVVDLAHFLVGPIDRVVAQTETTVTERPRLAMGEATHFALVEGGERAPVENEDTVVSLVRFNSGVTGTVEASRVTVGAQTRYAFEVNGTRGAVAWDFERLNELHVHLPVASGDAGYARILMGPEHPPYGNFQPGPGLAMGYDDLKVIEASLLLQSVVDGIQRQPGVREALAAANVVAAMERSSATAAWESVPRS